MTEEEKKEVRGIPTMEGREEEKGGRREKRAARRA